MKIDRIYIGCYSGDQRLTRILVASIRNCYPDIPITLLRDESKGGFDTSDIETLWQATIFDCKRTMFGMGYAKLEPLFLDKKERVLLLDSDQVFAGPVLNLIEQYDEDFLVARVNRPILDSDYISAFYFDLDALEKLDPDYRFPGFVFNAGSIVATTGVLSRSDFEPFVSWQGVLPEITRAEIFKLAADQGVLNYLLVKKQMTAQLSLRTVPFMKLVRYDDLSHLQVSESGFTKPDECIVHWAGRKPELVEDFKRSDILLHFEQLYRRRTPQG